MDVLKTTPYVIQEHLAKRAGRHFDFRIKYPVKKEALMCWAIPKAYFPKKPGERVLAVRTPDHALWWLDFEGELPEGEYGAGQVKIAQKGILEIYGWSGKFITFTISGAVATGKYVLYKYGTVNKKQESWLLIKGKD